MILLSISTIDSGRVLAALQIRPPFSCGSPSPLGIQHSVPRLNRLLPSSVSSKACLMRVPASALSRQRATWSSALTPCGPRCFQCVAPMPSGPGVVRLTVLIRASTFPGFLISGRNRTLFPFHTVFFYLPKCLPEATRLEHQLHLSQEVCDTVSWSSLSVVRLSTV